MTLDEIAGGAPGVLRPLIGGDPALAGEIQARLATCGLLDPPVDGRFGPVSHWALEQFLKHHSLDPSRVDADGARALLDPSSETDAYPIRDTNGTSLEQRIVRRMQALGHWICRHPDCFNIVYVEGIDPDGTMNDDAPNIFNDVRLLLRINRAGRPVIAGAWEATTEPGYYHTVIQRQDPRGAARIAFGQYKAWAIGPHPRSGATSHEALVQTANITVHRDFNADFQRWGDATFTGTFGINQHWGYDMPRTDIGKASAGCLVGRTKAGHREFMQLVRGDARYRASQGYRFMTTVLDGTTLE
jgi:hypothetical protein